MINGKSSSYQKCYTNSSAKSAFRLMPAKLLNCVPNEEKKHLEQLHPPISAVSPTVPSP